MTAVFRISQGTSISAKDSACASGWYMELKRSR